MERRLTKKVETHQLSFKNDLKEWIMKNKNMMNSDNMAQFLTFIYEDPNISLTQEDFQK